MASPTATNGPDPTTPLWRAAQVYRLLSCVYALGFQIAINSDLRHPALDWLLFAVLIGWSAACALAYLRGFGRRPAWVIAEIVIVVLLVLSTVAVASRQWELDNQAWPTTLWATNATVSAALQFGPVAGMAAGVAVAAADAAVKGYLNLNLGRSATIVIELAVGLVVGMAASGCLAKSMTASSRCWPLSPGVAAKWAAPHPNSRTLPANRNAHCDGF